MTRVQLAQVSDRQIAAYVASGKSLGYAGFLPWEAVGVSRFEPPTFKHGVGSTRMLWIGTSDNLSYGFHCLILCTVADGGLDPSGIRAIVPSCEIKLKF